MAKIVRARAVAEPAPREPWHAHWLVGVGLLLGALVAAWVLAGAPAIVITGW